MYLQVCKSIFISVSEKQVAYMLATEKYLSLCSYKKTIYNPAEFQVEYILHISSFSCIMLITLLF